MTKQIVVVAIVCAIVCIGLAIASLLTHHWYDVTGMNQGAFKRCTDGQGCGSLTFPDIENQLCSRSGSMYKLRVNFSRGLFIAGCGLGLLSITLCFGTLAMKKVSKGLVTTAAVFSCIGSLAIGAALVVWIHTMRYWYYCGESYCRYLERQDIEPVNCEAKPGFSYWLAVGAGGSLALSTFFLAIALGKRKRLDAQYAVQTQQGPMVVVNQNQVVDDEKHYAGPKDSPREEYPAAVHSAPRATTPAPPSHPPQSQTPMRSLPPADTQPRTAQRVPPASPAPNTPSQAKRTAAVPDGVPPPPEGDWEYDHDAKLYWSESAYLFLHPQTNQYFDPNSGMWYDPDTDTWYNPEDE